MRNGQRINRFKQMKPFRSLFHKRSYFFLRRFQFEMIRRSIATVQDIFEKLEEITWVERKFRNFINLSLNPILSFNIFHKKWAALNWIEFKHERILLDILVILVITRLKLSRSCFVILVLQWFAIFDVVFIAIPDNSESLMLGELRWGSTFVSRNT